MFVCVCICRTTFESIVLFQPLSHLSSTPFLFGGKKLVSPGDFNQHFPCVNSTDILLSGFWALNEFCNVPHSVSPRNSCRDAWIFL